MPAKSKLPYLFLFIAAFIAGIIPFSAPLEHHWTLQDLLLSVNTPLSGLFKPFLGTSTRMFLFRPVSLLLLKILYFFFRFNIAPYRIYKALFLSFFSMSVYAYLNLFAPRSERRNFWVALLSALSPPVFVSTYMITAEDIPGCFFMFTSLVLLLNLYRHADEKHSRLIFWFYICVAMTCLIRETSRMHLFLLMGLHFLHARKNLSGDSRKHTFYAMGMCAAATGISVFLMSHVAVTPWLKLPPTPAHEAFLLQNAFHQIVACLSLSAIAFILFTVLARKIYTEKPRRFLLFILYVLLFMFTKSQPLISFSYFGLAVFSPNAVIPVTGILFALFLLTRLRGAQSEEKFSAQAILIIFAATVSATMLLKTVREDLPSRTFISLLPFLLYFAVESAVSLHALCVRQRQAGKRVIFLRLARAYFFINMALYFLFSPVNYAFEFQQHAFSGDESKRFLARQPLKDRLVFYTNDAFPSYPEDFGMLNPAKENKTLDPHLFFVLEPYKRGISPEESQKKIKEEICLKAAGLFVHVDFKGERGSEKLVVTWPKKFSGFKEDAYIHITSDKTYLRPLASSSYFEGDFFPYSRESLSEFVPSGKFSSRGYWENSMPWLMQHDRFSAESDLEQLLNSLGAKLLYKNELSYVRLPQSLEEAWLWQKENRSSTLQCAAESKIYALKISRLNCRSVLHIKPGTKIIPRDFYSQ